MFSIDTQYSGGAVLYRAWKARWPSIDIELAVECCCSFM
jgi:hypothetical protein